MAKATSAFAARLKKLSGKWNAARTEAKAKQTGGASPVPAGRYIGQLVEAKLDEKGDNKWLCVSFKFRIVKGEETGNVLFRNSGIGDDQGLLYTAMDLRRLGVDADEVDLETIEATLADLTEAKPVCRLNAKENPSSDWPNVYIDKVVEMDESEFDQPGEGAAADPGTTDDAGGDAPTEVAIEVGAEVLCGKKNREGVVKDVEGEEVTVKMADTKKLETFKVADVALKDAEEAPAATDEAPTFEDGEEVTFGGKPAKILSIEDDKAVIKITATKKIVSDVDLTDLEKVGGGDDAAADDAGDPPSVGDEVIITVNKKDLVGKVTKIDAKKEVATVVTTKDKKTHVVPFAEVFYAQAPE